MIVEATNDDVPFITAIYAHYVRKTTCSFETRPPNCEEMGRRMTTVRQQGLPFLVAAADNRVIGYAYAALYRARVAYRYTVEDSIYIAPDFTGKGIGRALLTSLIDQCTHSGYRQMVAVIGDSGNAPSIGLHRSLGFRRAGVLESAGWKFNRWVDSVLMQRSLGDGNSCPPR